MTYKFPLTYELQGIMERLSVLTEPVEDIDEAQEILEDAIVDINHMKKRLYNL